MLNIDPQIYLYHYIPEDSSSWRRQWPQPESAVSRNVAVDNELSGYNPEGEAVYGCFLKCMVTYIFNNDYLALSNQKKI